MSEFYILIGANQEQVPLLEQASFYGAQLLGIDRNIYGKGISLCNHKIEAFSLFEEDLLYRVETTLPFDSIILGAFHNDSYDQILTWSFFNDYFHLYGPSRTQIEMFFDRKKIYERLQEIIKHPNFKTPKLLKIKKSTTRTEIHNVGYPQLIKNQNKLDKETPSVLYSKEYSHTKELISTCYRKKNIVAYENILIEEYLQGEELLIFGFIQDFKYHLISIIDQKSSTKAPFIDLEFSYPSNYLDEKEVLLMYHENIAKVLNIESTPLLTRWKVVDNSFYLLSLRPSIPNIYINNYLIKEANYYDVYKNLFSLTLGQAIQKAESFRIHKRIILRFFDRPIRQYQWENWKKSADFTEVICEEPIANPKTYKEFFGVMGFSSTL